MESVLSYKRLVTLCVVANLAACGDDEPRDNPHLRHVVINDVDQKGRTNVVEVGFEALPKKGLDGVVQKGGKCSTSFLAAGAKAFEVDVPADAVQYLIDARDEKTMFEYDSRIGVVDLEKHSAVLRCSFD
jgi:hypothetical protein